MYIKNIHIDMDSNDYKKIMQFFPPVNSAIQNPYEEAVYSYKLYDSKSPLKQPQENTMYSFQIMNDLKILRILLHSKLSPERFIYEINKMYQAWGPEGQFGRNILNKQFIDLFISVKEKEEKLQELMKEGSSIASDYELGQLEKQLKDFSLKHTYHPRVLSELDLSVLDIKSGNKSNKSNKSKINSSKLIQSSRKSIGKKKISKI